MKKLIFFLLIIGFLATCQSKSKANLPKQASGKLRYDLNQPDEKYWLREDETAEISGLTYYQKNQLAFVQDEEAKLYIYDTQKKRIVQRVTFGKSGDYEGVEFVNGNIYAVRSTGTLYRFEIPKGRKIKAEVIKTPLTGKNDVEGLGYDALKNHLLLTCKESPHLDGKKAKEKAIYAFDLNKNELLLEPIFRISLKKLKEFLSQKPDLQEIMAETKFQFKPSGIAINPIDKKIYMTASEGNLLLVLNEDGSFFEAIDLPPKQYKQPEGICFSPEGTLYISSEGKGENGYILQFNYLKP